MKPNKYLIQYKGRSLKIFALDIYAAQKQAKKIFELQSFLGLCVSIFYESKLFKS